MASFAALAQEATPPVAPPPADTPPAKAAAPARPATPAVKPGTAQQVVPKVEVTGQRNSNEDRRVSTAAKIIISREDIEQYGDSNLGDVMRRLPGVTQGGRPGRGGPVQMRGMGGGFTQILLNGERIPPGFSIEQITPEQVERIEILRAPTAETGARAIAGTINIILREPLRARHNDIRAGITSERNHFSEDASWSRNDSLSNTGTYNMSLSMRHSDQLTDTLARTRYTNTLSGATDLDQRNFSQQLGIGNHLFFSSRLQWRLGPGENFTLTPFIVSHRNHSITEGRLDQFAGAQPAQYATSRNRTDLNFDVMRFMSMLNKRIDQDTRYELRASGGQFSSDSFSALNQFSSSGARTLLQTTGTDAKDKSWNIAGKLSHSWGDAKHALVGGWELEGVKRTENSITLLNGVQQLADFGEQLNVATRRTAFYAQDEWDPRPEFGSYFGLRWESIETRSDTNNANVRNTSRVLTPLAHGVWRFAAPSRDQLRLSLTQSYRAPTTQSLVSRPSLNTLFPVPGANTSVTPDRAGNPLLKPELANGIDLAYENYLKAGGIVSVNLFARRIRDLIRNVTTLETVSWATSQRYVSRPQNLGNATTRGIEFDAKFQLTELIESAAPVNVRANLSLYNSSVDGVKGPNNRIDQQPRATGNLGADYRFRATPLSIGGNLSWTPAYETQQTNLQLQKLSTKRVIDTYVLWTIDSATKLRLSISNIAPRDLDTTSSIFEGSQLQTVVSSGRTDMSAALRLEMRL